MQGKSFFMIGMLGMVVAFSAVPVASAGGACPIATHRADSAVAADFATTNAAGGRIAIIGNLCGGTPGYNPCVRTDATCGPYGDAWVYAEIDWGNVQVCVTSNTAHILC